MVELSPSYMQELCYTAQQDRLMLGNLVGAQGVANMGGGALLVTTGGSGLGLSVAQGGCWIKGDDDDRGFYSCYNDAPVTVTVSANASGNPRIDQVIARVYDSTYGEGSDEWQLEVLAGTPDSDANITNQYTTGFLDGAASLPDNAITLAYILVPNGFAGPFVNATHILDARVPAGAGTAGWIDYNPVLSNSLATSVEKEFRYTRTGNTVTVDFVIWLGANASTDTMTIDVPTFLPARVPSGGLNYLLVGNAVYYNTGGVIQVAGIYLDNADYIKFLVEGGTADWTGPTVLNDYLTGSFTYETTAL